MLSAEEKFSKAFDEIYRSNKPRIRAYSEIYFNILYTLDYQAYLKAVDNYYN